MTLLLKILGGAVISALFLWVKYSQAKSIYSKDLGDGRIQKLFDEESK